MDLGEDGAWPVIMADYIDRILTVWHSSRYLVVGLLALSILSLVLRQRRLVRLSSGPTLSPASEEKTAWLEKPSVNDKSAEPTQTKTPAAKAINRAAATKVLGQKPLRSKSDSGKEADHVLTVQPHIFYLSLTGTTAKLAQDISSTLQSEVNKSLLAPQIHDLAYTELDDYFISGPKEQTNLSHFYLLLLPSYDIDTITMNFLSHLEETHYDFRVDTGPLSSLAGYAVFGVGDTEGWPTEAQGFCQQAIQVDRWMAKLTGGKRAYPLGMGDVKSNVEIVLSEWTRGVCSTIVDLVTNGSLGAGVPGSGNAYESADEDLSDNEEPSKSRQRKRQKLTTTDLEDVGGRSPIPIDFTTFSSPTSKLPTATTSMPETSKQMVPITSPTHAALTKQGYSIIGSHSGVKICRWTKSALRGRGSCYKYSFYGIKSHLCMETTPSLSCSNKCVFCWRHGTNPVSTTWRWTVDPPDLIFAGAQREHYKKIKSLRGVPGVRAERFAEAMRIRHCALSLVGEPVFYPRINELLDLLHGERISTFLVCNAQHPAELARLRRVTQLYVSIDAGTRESLRTIDRPLHRDFWERTLACLDIVRARRSWQRTVYRLTLVKAYNVAEEEIEGYADLIERGRPGFVEIKGVTYCGTGGSKKEGLTMGNVPFWEEVLDFVEVLGKALERRGLGCYGVAAEHRHSCCVLLADRGRFFREGKWYTVIDYGRFFELLEGDRTGKGEGVNRGDQEEEVEEVHTWGPEDYMLPTAEWAGPGQGGFDPNDERVDRKGNLVKVEL